MVNDDRYSRKIAEQESYALFKTKKQSKQIENRFTENPKSNNQKK